VDESEKDHLARQEVSSRVHLRRVAAGLLSILTFAVVIWTIVGIILAVSS
jgi:hypothetical protein